MVAAHTADLVARLASDRLKARLVDIQRALIHQALLGKQAALNFLSARGYPLDEALALLAR